MVLQFYFVASIYIYIYIYTSHKIKLQNPKEQF